MRPLVGITTIALLVGCGRSPQPASPTKPLHTASARDTAFIRESCAMPDSVLAGTRPCIDRVQASKVRVF
jgi:hypothetical protein